MRSGCALLQCGPRTRRFVARRPKQTIILQHLSIQDTLNSFKRSVNRFGSPESASQFPLRAALALQKRKGRLCRIKRCGDFNARGPRLCACVFLLKTVREPPPTMRNDAPKSCRPWGPNAPWRLLCLLLWSFRSKNSSILSYFELNNIAFGIEIGTN